MIAYHGTDKCFDEFSLDGAENQEGFHFTPHQWYAEGYGKIIIKAELKLLNPVRLSEDEWLVNEFHGEKFRKHYQGNGHDGWLVVMPDGTIQEVGVFDVAQIKVLEKRNA